MTIHYGTSPRSPPSPSNYDQNSINSAPYPNDRAPHLPTVTAPGTEYESTTGQILPHYGYLSGVQPRGPGNGQLPAFSDNLSRHTSLFQQESQANDSAQRPEPLHQFDAVATHMPRTLRGGTDRSTRAGWRQKRSKKWWIIVAGCAVLAAIVIIVPAAYLAGRHKKDGSHGKWTYPFPVNSGSPSVSPTGTIGTVDGDRTSGTASANVGLRTSSTALRVSSSLPSGAQDFTPRTTPESSLGTSGLMTQSSAFSLPLSSISSSAISSTGSSREDVPMSTVHTTFTSTLHTTTTTTLPMARGSAMRSSQASESPSVEHNSALEGGTPNVEESSSIQPSSTSRFLTSFEPKASLPASTSTISQRSGNPPSSAVTDSTTAMLSMLHVESTTTLLDSTSLHAQAMTDGAASLENETSGTSDISTAPVTSPMPSTASSLTTSKERVYSRTPVYG